MASLKPDLPPGWDDGPSRPGVATRRMVTFFISGLLLVSTPIVLLMLWGMAHPTFGPGTVKPVTSTVTIGLSIGRNEWPKLVQATDRLAIQHGLVDRQTGSLQPSSELRVSRVRYEGSGAELVVAKVATANAATTPNAATIEVHIEIREYSNSGEGQRLKTALENDVIKAGRFGE